MTDKTTKAAEVPAPRFAMDRMLWDHLIAIGTLHILCLFAPFTFSWGALAVAAFLYWVSGCLGVTLGYHRLFTHQSFETSKFIRYSLAIFGTLAYQGGPIKWVGQHRTHHRDSDKNGDPHSPKHGFFWGHMLWCMMDDHLGRDPRALAKDLQKDKFLVLIDKWFWVPQVVLAIALFLIGGFGWVVWGVALRTVLEYHSTWFVNSASHTWGYKNFRTKDDSRNNWWVALISWGEGWHNNHHAHQRSARHGMRWYEFDFTWWTIQVMELLGLVRKVYVPDVKLGERYPGGDVPPSAPRN